MQPAAAIRNPATHRQRLKRRIPSARKKSPDSDKEWRSPLRDLGEVEVVDSLPDTNSGKPYSVPDTGSTVALLAFSVALLALSQRKISRAE